MKAAAPPPPPRSSPSHSHPHRQNNSTSTTPLTQGARAPSSAGPAMPTSVTSLRTPASKEQARPSSPNYFGLSVDPVNYPRDTGIGPKDSWSPPTSSIRSFNAQTPKHIPVEANPDFEAFRKQTAANQTFSLGHGNLSHFALTPNLTGDKPPSSNENIDVASLDHVDVNDGETTISASPSNTSAFIHGGSPSYFDPSRHESRTNTQTICSLPPAPSHVLPQVDDRHPRLSLPGNMPSPPSPQLRQQDGNHRSDTLPSVLEDGSAFISASDLRDLLREQPSSKCLLLDLRVAPQYAQSRIRTALNLCIPTTLLKRPSFNLAKLTHTFKIDKEQSRFCRWKTCDYIIVYDSHSSEKKDAVAAVNTIKKFTNEGWDGKAYILRGGFMAFSRIQDDLIDRRPAHEMKSSRNLALGSLVPDITHVAGGCEMPEAKSAANPFFSNIRQNMDLVGGVGQIDVKRPDDADHQADDFFPPWLRKAAAIEDHGKTVSEKFLHIEQEELSRMQKALSARVSYGTPAPASEKAVQIAGFEKGGKNRYNNIWPFEHARVRLQGRPEGVCDYVNASHIKALWSNKRYIASQGPLPATFEDFWSVVWDQDVRVIVMLTAESEGGQLKCHPYWAAQDYGQYKVKALSEKKVSLDPHKHRRPSTRQELPGRRRANTVLEPSIPEIGSGDNPHVIVRKIALFHSTQPFAPMREITQLHYSSWPDFGAPAQPSHLLGLVELSNSLQRGALPPGIASQTRSDEPEPAHFSRPILVHCSAGCGRTGTFCTVDSVIDMLKRQRKEHHIGITPMDMSNTDEADYMSKDNSISEGVDIDWVFNPNIDLIEHTVEDFRKQRISMVQSLKQYVLCYETVLEWVSQQHRAGRRERSGSESLASNDR